MSARPPVTPHPTTRGNVIGIDIGGTNIDVALADASGAIRQRTRMATQADRGPQQALERIARLVDELSRWSTAIDGVPVVAHAAVCPGVVQAECILMAPNLPGWETLALARRLSRDLHVTRVAVWNDVRAGALAELRYGALRGVDPALYVSLGTGIAAALVVDGRVLAGFHHAAGEIAYLVPVGAPPEHLGDHVGDTDATLEDFVGGKALGERASALLGGRVSASELFARTDSAARDLVGHSMDVLATAIANIAVLVDPERVVVGGGMMASADVILPVLADRLKRVVPFAPEVVAAHFTEDASLHGAIALALDTATADTTTHGNTETTTHGNTETTIYADSQPTPSREPK
jgi:glucokinase